jgi:hypothetical protein
MTLPTDASQAKQAQLEGIPINDSMKDLSNVKPADAIRQGKNGLVQPF